MAGVGRLRIAAASILVVAAVLAGWASAPSGSGLSRLFEAATQPRGAVTARPPRLIVIIEENHSFEEIIGSPAAPFLNRLAAHGTLLTHSYAVTHPSPPNYAALLSGRTPIRSDCRACTFTGPTLVDQLEACHISWAATSKGCPSRAPWWPAPAPTPRRSIRSSTPPGSGTSHPVATGCCRSAASLPTWPGAGCPPSSSSSGSSPPDALRPGPGRRRLAAAPGRRAAREPGLAAGHPPGRHLRREQGPRRAVLLPPPGPGRPHPHHRGRTTGPPGVATRSPTPIPAVADRPRDTQ